MIASPTRTNDIANHTPEQQAAQTFPVDSPSSGQIRNTIPTEVEDYFFRILGAYKKTSQSHMTADQINTQTPFFRELEAICMVDTAALSSAHIPIANKGPKTTATHPLIPGQFICEIRGTISLKSTFPPILNHQSNIYFHPTLDLLVDTRKTIDNPLRMFRRSCTPTAELKSVIIPSASDWCIHLGVIALGNIPAGSELTVAWSLEEQEWLKKKKVMCPCNTANCPSQISPSVVPNENSYIPSRTSPQPMDVPTSAGSNEAGEVHDGRTLSREERKIRDQLAIFAKMEKAEKRKKIAHTPPISYKHERPLGGKKALLRAFLEEQEKRAELAKAKLSLAEVEQSEITIQIQRETISTESVGTNDTNQLDSTRSEEVIMKEEITQNIYSETYIDTAKSSLKEESAVQNRALLSQVEEAMSPPVAPVPNTLESAPSPLPPVAVLLHSAKLHPDNTTSVIPASKSTTAHNLSAKSNQPLHVISKENQPGNSVEITSANGYSRDYIASPPRPSLHINTVKEQPVQATRDVEPTVEDMRMESATSTLSPAMSGDISPYLSVSGGVKRNFDAITKAPSPPVTAAPVVTTNSQESSSTIDTSPPETPTSSRISFKDYKKKRKLETGEAVLSRASPEDKPPDVTSRSSAPHHPPHLDSNGHNAKVVSSRG